MKLNLGCGKDIRQGWVNVDNRPGEGVDMLVDLRNPLPFPDKSVEHVLASHVFEHILNWEDLLLEIYRVLIPGGTVEIRVPYGLCPLAYHIRMFNEHTMDRFLLGIEDGAEKSLETQRLFEQASRTINRHLPYRWHLNRYLHLKIPDLPIGTKREIVWNLRKPTEDFEKR